MARRRAAGAQPGRSGASGATPARKLFFIGGNNGREMLKALMEERGWQEADDKDTPVYMKWVEIKRDINFDAFREGRQLLARNPKIRCLTTKITLLESLRAYERILKVRGSAARRGGRPALSMDDFVPLTYKLDNPRERSEFLANSGKSPIWICKPTGMNQGKGIFLVDDVAAFAKQLQEEDSAARPGGRQRMRRIIQLYVGNPLLLRRRKFDIRAYMLVASVDPPIVLYHRGYCRLSCEDYQADDPSNLTAHLTNQYVQKQHPHYQERKEDTVWSMEQLAACAVDELGQPESFASDLEARMKAIMRHCFRSVQSKLDPRKGLFDLLGFDFMLDTDWNMWLIEINVNPALHTNCAVLQDLLPGVVRSTLDVCEAINTSSSAGPTLQGVRDSMGAYQIVHTTLRQPKGRPGAATATKR